MTSWWQWNPSEGASRGGFAGIGVGRFGSAVCSELAKAGAEVLAIDASQRAIDELRQINPAIEARVVDCTDEEALRAAGVHVGSDEDPAGSRIQPAAGTHRATDGGPQAGVSGNGPHNGTGAGTYSTAAQSPLFRIAHSRTATHYEARGNHQCN